MTGMPLTMQQALPKVNGVISADYDLSSVPVATVFVTFFYFRSIFNITGGERSWKNQT